MRLFFLFALLLTGCATAQTAPAPPITPGPAAAPEDLIPLIQKLTKADVDQALAIATAAGDADGVQCFTSLQGHLADGTLILPTPAGAVSAVELARVVDLRLRGGLPKDLIQACAVYTFDLRMFLARLGLTALQVPLPK